jgi:hypothetical protein
MAIVSTVATVGGEIAGGNAAAAAGKANANALRLQGKQEIAVGNMNASDIRDQGRKSVGAIVAQQGANGVALDSSTAMDVQAADVTAYETDALRAIYGGQIKAWGLNTEANIKQAEGKAAQRSAYFKAAGTLIGNAVTAGAFDGLKFGGGKTAGSYLETGNPSFGTTNTVRYG